MVRTSDERPQPVETAGVERRGNRGASPRETGSVPVTISRTKSGAVRTIAQAAYLHRGLGRWPSGNSSRAIGRNRAMDHGQENMNTVTTRRSSGSGPPLSCRISANGAIRALVA